MKDEYDFSDAEQGRFFVPIDEITRIPIRSKKGFAHNTGADFRERPARGDLAAFDAWLAVSPDVPPVTGDGLDD